MKEIDPKERKKVEDMVDQLIYRPTSEDKEKMDAEILALGEDVVQEIEWCIKQFKWATSRNEDDDE